jgi:bifunctional NMN adenylyltransferase/nudix hydrolase
MEIKTEYNTKDFQVGALVGRFHVDELHIGHRDLLDHVISNHKKVILFLGVSKTVSNKNPLDYATRKGMVQSEYPDIIILPLVDQRYNDIWSNNLDSALAIPFGEKKVLIYGSRDSFIPSYKGKNKTVELTPSFDYSGTELREEIASVVVNHKYFRAGAIYSVYAGRGTTFPTVDICAYNEKGEILMARKPNETLWRFVGGFVDRNDETYEVAAKREFYEETGGNARIGELTYICSQQVHDWRYKGTEHGIMTTLFLARFGFGNAVASDDLANGGAIKWVSIKEFSNYDGIRANIMPEHRELMLSLVNKVYGEKLIPNIGSRLAERTDNVIYINE